MAQTQTQTEREAWLEQRRSVIGGTDISAIVGRNPWRSALDVYCDKLGLGEPTPENNAMRMGKLLEPYVKTLYQEETGYTVTDGVFATHPTIPYIGGTPDGIIVGGHGIEIKTTRSSNGWGEPGTDEVPDHYLMQCAWYMAVTGYAHWDLAVLIAGSDFRIYSIERDRNLETALLDAGKQFWNNHVLTETPPAPDHNSADVLKALYPRHANDVMLTATGDLDNLAWELSCAKGKLESAEQEKARIENLIKAAIADNSGVTGNNWKATWKANKDGSTTDWKAVATEMGVTNDIVARYTTTKPGARVFRFSYGD